jgi:CMP-N-acetylneuraminic acid synthetase
MDTIAVVIARGGSIRVPRKNVQPMCGLPLVAWSIIAARCSHTVDYVYLSTDDDEIAEIGEKWGAEIIRRPDWPDADTTAANRPYMHAIDVLEEKHGMDYCMVQLLPTSPQRKPDDIDRGVEHWRKTGGHVIGAVPRRETFIYRKVKNTVARAVLQDKAYNYLEPVSGIVNVCSPSWYRWFVPRIGSDQDAEINKMMDDGEHIEQDFYYVECEPWQAPETDVPVEFEFTAACFEHFVLKGRGIDVYYDYAAKGIA